MCLRGYVHQNPNHHSNFPGSSANTHSHRMEEIVSTIVSQAALHKPMVNSNVTISVGPNNTTLSVSAYGTTFSVDFNTLPHFMDRVPEIIIIYILAQILKIYCATPDDGPVVIKQANLNICHKILVMTNIGEHLKDNAIA